MFAQCLYVCVFSSFILFLSVFFVIHRNELVLLNLISRKAKAKKMFLQSNDILDLCKVNFCIRKLIIHCNAGSCCVYITGGVNIYLYVCKSIGPSVSCVCLSLCVISNQSTSINHVIRVKPSVKLMSCCIKHTARFC